MSVDKSYNPTVFTGQNNFAAGELAPSMEGRADTPLYQSGVKKMINWLVLPSGSIIRRPGTELIYAFGGKIKEEEAKEVRVVPQVQVPDVPQALPVMERAYGQKRLINLLYSRDLSLLLCLEQKNEVTLLIRVLMQGESLLQILQVTLPNAFELNDLTYSPAKGVLYLCFGVNHSVYTITIDDKAFQKMVLAVEEEIKNQKNYLEQRKKELDEFYQDFPKFEVLHIVHAKYRQGGAFREEGYRWVDKDFKQLSYYYAIATAKKKHAAVLKDLISFKTPLPLKISYEENELNTLLKDFDSAAQLEEKLKASADKVKKEQVSGALIVPYNNRLWCFGSRENIHSVHASNKGDYRIFNTAYRSLLEVRNPLNALWGTFASDAFDAPLWAQALGNDLLIGTTDGIYTLNEGDRAKGEFIKIHKELDLALSPIAPVVLGKTLFFVEGGGKRLSCLYYSREKGGYQVHNLTAYADHLFSAGIIRIAAVSTPFNMIFALLGNGQLAVLTYDSDLKLFGWSQQILGGGSLTPEASSHGAMILDLCVVPTTNEDKLYLLVKRDHQTTIEVLKLSQISSLVQKGTHYLDGHTALKDPEEIIKDKELEKLITTREFWEERDGLPEGFYYLEGRIRSQIQLLLRFIQGGDFLLDGKAYRDMPESTEAEKKAKEDRLQVADYIVRHIGISLIDQIGNYYKIYYLTTKLLNMIGDTSCRDNFNNSDSSIWQQMYLDILTAIADYHRLKDTTDLELDALTSNYTTFSCPALNIRFNFTDCEFKPEDKWINLIKEKSKKLVDFMMEFNGDNDRKLAVQMYEQWMATANASFIKKHVYGSTPNYKMISRWNQIATEEDIWDLKQLEEIKANYVYNSRTFLQEQLPVILKHLGFNDDKQLSEQMTIFYQALLYDFKRCQEAMQYKQFDAWEKHWQKLLESYFHQQKIALPELQDKFTINMDASREDILRMAKVCIGEEVSVHTINLVSSEENEGEENEEGQLSKSFANMSQISQGRENVQDLEDKLSAPVITKLYQADGKIFDEEELEEIKLTFRVILKEMELFLISKLKIITTEDQVFLEHLMQENQSLKFLRCLLFDRKNFLFSKDLIGLISPQDYQYLCAAMQPKQNIFYSDKLVFYHGQRVLMMGRDNHGSRIIGSIPAAIKKITEEIESLENQLKEKQDKDKKTELQSQLKRQQALLAQLKEQHELEQKGFLHLGKADSNMTIGYAYQSYLETFPLVFPAEQEGFLKKNASLNIKVHETKSLTVYAQQDNGKELSYPIKSSHFELDDLRLFLSDKAYLVKEVAALVGRPYLNDWVEINLQSPVKKDISIKMIAEQPVAASVLKIEVKAQLLPHYT